MHAARLAEFISSSKRLVVLTGAGCSTASGIPDYRGPNGTWKTHRPVQYGEFIRSADRRRHYWARSYSGWQRFCEAQPNPAHRVLSTLERGGLIHFLITQNVDRLHHAAGSTKVLELHGRNDRVICLECGRLFPREEVQAQMRRDNPAWATFDRSLRPDGDSDIDRDTTSTFNAPHCAACGGILKPDVVFFGESVPRPIVERATSLVDEADALLVVGSSLTVWSGYRFARAAHAAGKPVALLNLGASRADDLASLKIEAHCEEILPEAVELVTGSSTGGPDSSKNHERAAQARTGGVE